MPDKESGRNKEGEIFAVPLTDGRYALGVVARSSKVFEGAFRHIVCYFFGPRLEEPPKTPPDLRPEDTVWIKVFDNQAIERGDWPIIGPHPRFDRGEWPIPDFCRRDEANQKFYRRRLYPDDPSQNVEESRISVEEAERLPIGGGMTFSAPRNSFLAGLLQDAPIDPSKKYLLHARALDWDGIVREAQQRLSSDPEMQFLSGDPQSERGGEPVTPEHAVILRLPLVGPDLEVAGLSLRELEERLSGAIEANDAGEFDGDLLAPEDATVYMYGPDADQLFAAIQPVLEALSLPGGSQAVKRYGSAGDALAKEIHVDLG